MSPFVRKASYLYNNVSKRLISGRAEILCLVRGHEKPEQSFRLKRFVYKYQTIVSWPFEIFIRPSPPGQVELRGVLAVSQPPAYYFWKFNLTDAIYSNRAGSNLIRNRALRESHKDSNLLASFLVIKL